MVGETGTAAQKVLRGPGDDAQTCILDRAFCRPQRMGLMRPD